MTGIHSANTSLKNGPWITIGTFDGIHLGHQALIKMLVEGAKRNQCPSIIVTFFPNPVVALKKVKDPLYLSQPEEKDQLIRALGVDSILTIFFDRTISRLSPRDFVTILFQQLKFSCLLIGYDFRLGADRAGGIITLKQLGEEMGFCVRAIDALVQDSQPISSSNIREELLMGNLGTANHMLGYPYSIEGIVVHGDGRGKHIGLPTANIAVWKNKLLPADGVYAAFAIIDKKKVPSVISIGIRPTFYEKPTERTIEAHLLNFSDQIYQNIIKIQFISRLREERKYKSVPQLMNQVHKDILNAEEILKNGTHKTNLST